MKLRKITAFAAAVMIAASASVLPVFAEDAAPAETAPAETAETAPAAEETSEESAPAEKHPEGIAEIDGKVFCFDKNGEKITGQWATDSEGNKFYFRKDGERAENISLLLDGRLFKFDEKGTVVYSDPTLESGETTFTPPVLGSRASDLFSTPGIVLWKKGKARTDAYAYNAYTFIMGRKCPLTFEFDKYNTLTAWYIDIPASENEQLTMLNWLMALWGTDCEIDEENRAAYWYYTDDGSGEKRGIAAAFSNDMLSISTIKF